MKLVFGVWWLNDLRLSPLILSSKVWSCPTILSHVACFVLSTTYCRKIKKTARSASVYFVRWWQTEACDHGTKWGGNSAGSYEALHNKTVSNSISYFFLVLNHNDRPPKTTTTRVERSIPFQYLPTFLDDVWNGKISRRVMGRRPDCYFGVKTSASGLFTIPITKTSANQMLFTFPQFYDVTHL